MALSRFPLRLLFRVAAVLLLAALSLFALASWSIAAYPGPVQAQLRATQHIAQAPFATRIVLGDSRVAMAESDGETLLIGFDGATFPQLERLIGLVCNVSGAPMTIALGVNDTIPALRDVQSTMASARRSIETCGAERVSIAGIWDPEPAIGPLGGYYDTATLAILNSQLEKLAMESGAAFLPAPQGITGHTFDGVHFTRDISSEYIAHLTGKGAQEELAAQ